MIWSDHGTNFVGADRELQELVEFLELQKTNADISFLLLPEDHIEIDTRACTPLWWFVGGCCQESKKAFTTCNN